MEPWLLAVILKPLLFPVFMLALFIPAACGRVLVQRWMKDGKLKRFLLRK